MKKYCGSLATNNTMSDGTKFSDAALSSMANQCLDFPVTLNFDPKQVIGLVKKSILDKDGLSVEVDLNQEKLSKAVQVLLEDGSLFAVPGGIRTESRTDGKNLVIDNLMLTSVSFVLSPADRSLTPVKKLPDND